MTKTRHTVLVKPGSDEWAATASCPCGWTAHGWVVGLQQMKADHEAERDQPPAAT